MYLQAQRSQGRQRGRGSRVRGCGAQRGAGAGAAPVVVHLRERRDVALLPSERLAHDAREHSGHDLRPSVSEGGWAGDGSALT
jgi:hypothetical protein